MLLSCPRVSALLSACLSIVFVYQLMPQWPVSLCLCQLCTASVCPVPLSCSSVYVSWLDLVILNARMYMYCMYMRIIRICQQDLYFGWTGSMSMGFHSQYHSVCPLGHSFYVCISHKCICPSMVEYQTLFFTCPLSVCIHKSLGLSVFCACVTVLL